VTLARAIAGLADNGLKDSGEGDTLQPRYFRRNLGGISDGIGESDGLSLDHFQRQAVHRRADRSQVPQFAAPLFARDAANMLDRLQHEVANGSSGSRRRRPRTNQIAQSGSNLLVAIDDQLFLAREVVVDGLLRHLGRASHVGHRNLFVSLLGKESGGGIGDEPPSTGLLEFTQSRISHDSSIYGLL
jgi:hypothetical protein